MNDKKIKEATKHRLIIFRLNQKKSTTLLLLTKRFMQRSAQIKINTKRLLYGLLER